MSKRKLFLGVEAEGPFQGIMTLFVGEATISSYSTIKENVAKYSLKQIYFGADDRSPVDVDLLNKVLDEKLAPLITLELGKNMIDINELTKPADDTLFHLVLYLPELDCATLMSVLIPAVEKIPHMLVSLKDVKDGCVRMVTSPGMSLTSNSLQHPLYSMDSLLS